MANITYRKSLTPVVQNSNILKNSTLTALEVDGNFKSISLDLDTKLATKLHSFNFPVVAANNGQQVISLTALNPIFSKQTVIFFLLAISTVSISPYTVELLLVSLAGASSTVYQSAITTGNYKDIIPFSVDRNVLGDDLRVKITNIGTTTAIADLSVRMLIAGA